MVCRTGAGQVQDDDQQRESERDCVDHVDPSRCAVQRLVHALSQHLRV